MPKEYNHRAIEEKWRKIWKESRLYHVDDVVAASGVASGADSGQEKFYCLDMFPGISGSH